MHWKILERLSFGANKASLEQIEKMGFEAFVKEQLNPKTEPHLEEIFQNFSFSEESKRKQLRNKKLNNLNISKKEIAQFIKEENTNKIEFLTMEFVMATYLRTIHSKYQLNELVVDFWHNHFNVSIHSSDEVNVAFGLYDRDVIRKHSLGNFRSFLEAVAKSPAMLFYLDNAFSKASPANENYARELFELHTLGADNYLNHLYNKWKEVPKDENDIAKGYIDEDIYEAARAFTGWTVGIGQRDGKGGRLPISADFHYEEAWHDNYQKRVLGVEFYSNQAPLEDGLKVLDLLANHPATAKHICTKLCKRFISDNPPASIVEKATEVWMQHLEDEAQIKKVIETIILSEEFKASLGTKFKRPNELLFSIIRKIDIDVDINPDLFWWVGEMGYQQFHWPSPTGHPDNEKYWLTSNMLLQRWNLPIGFLYENEETANLKDTMKIKELTIINIVDFWMNVLLGHSNEGKLKKALIKYMEPEFEYLIQDEEWFEHKLKQLVAYIAMSPEFQYK